MNGAQYLYLLQEREFVNSGKPIYKLGMTKQENLTRFKQYPKGSLLIMQIICNDCTILEMEVIKLFTDRFILRKDIGNEYFEGDHKSMIDVIYSTIKNEKVDLKDASSSNITDTELIDAATKEEVSSCDNFVEQFIIEKIVKDFSGIITKQELNDIFTSWFMKTYNKCAPNLNFMHSYMDKKFGKFEKIGVWLGVRFNSDDCVAKFVKDKIATIAGGEIKKQELNSEFTIWYMNAHGKHPPNLKELHYYMERIFGKIHYKHGGWLGVCIKYERDDAKDDGEQFDISIDF